MSFAAARPLNSEPEQDVTQNLAYHGEIGREATANAGHYVCKL